jgi:hypothetical protein
MKQHTLIENIKPEPHTYLVTIGTDLGQFTGVTACKPEDYEFESEYFGYELAEIKAEIEYSKAKRNHWSARALALSRFWREMSETRCYDIDAYWVKKMRKTLDEALYECARWADRITALKAAYKDKILLRDAANRRLKTRGLK